VGGTVAAGFKAVSAGENVTLNEFGMKMKPTDLYVEVVECPLKDAASEDDVAAYDFPDAGASGRFDIAAEQIEKYGSDYFVIGDCELSIFELAWHLTGLETYLMAMAGGEAWLEKLNERVEQWTTGLATQMVDLGVDALWFGENLGSQTSTLISPAMWRKMFRPRYEKMFKALHKRRRDLIIIMHSDGAVAPLLDDFIEMGVDVFNPVQPNVPGSDPAELKGKYGGKLSFFGGIDQQELLPSGDSGRIESQIKRYCQTLGAGGGYLAAPAHILQADVAPDTVKVMVEAVRKYGKY